MEHHVLVMHPGDKDLITAQIAARNGKTILLLKPNAVQIVLRTTSQKLAFQSVPCMGESYEQFVPEHLNYLKNKKMLPSLQQTSPPAVSTSMASHSLFTSMHQQITKIIYTAPVAQHVLVKLVE